MPYTKIILLTLIQICAFAAYIPQVIKVLVKRSSKDISVMPLLVSLISVVCYIIYGVMMDDGFIIITCVTEGILALISAMILYKYKNTK